MVSPVSSPPPALPLGPPPQPPPLSHLQLPHDFQIWTGKEHQTFFERISNLSPRIAVITPPQTSNPFTDLKPTFNQGLQKTLAREFLLNAQTCRCPVPAHQGEHQPFNRNEQKRERWENLPRGLQVR